MTRILIFYGVLASLPGCVAPETCQDEWGADPLPGASQSGEQTLTDAGEEGSVRFRATLRGLSELWPAEHPVRNASLSVVIHLDYVDTSQTGGVATQMPRFRLDLGNAAQQRTSYSQETPAFPPPSGVPVGSSLFTDCDGYDVDDLNCCEYGSTECSLELLLRYQRQEGEPFPPVALRWEADASASVETCPLGDEAELVLEVVEP